LGGIIIALLILYAAYLFIVYVLPVLLTVGLYGWSAYRAGGRLREQITRRYRLTEKSWLALVGIGLGTLLLSIIAVAISQTYGWLLIPLIVLFGLVTAMVTLDLWAWTKQRPYVREIRELRRLEADYAAQIATNERRQAQLRQENARLERRYGKVLQERQALEEIMRELCHGEAQTRSLRKRHWEREFRALPDGELRRRKEITLKQLRTASEKEQLSLTVQASLLRLEELLRQIGEPYRRLQRNRQQLAQLEAEKQRLQMQMNETREQRTRREGAYQAFRSSRIVLN